MQTAHLGITTGNFPSKLVVVYKQIPGDSMNSLVINVDKLVKGVDRDELNTLAHQPYSQSKANFVDVLHEKRLLEYFHKNNYMEKMSVDNILMTPTPNTTIPLRQIIDAINAQQGMPTLAKQEELSNISKANPYANKQYEEKLQVQGNANIAKNRFVQASAMLDDAKRMFSEVLKLDPTMVDAVNKVLNIPQPNVSQISTIQDANIVALENKAQTVKKQNKKPVVKKTIKK